MGKLGLEQPCRDREPPRSLCKEDRTVKTMSCKDLGGICDQKLTAASWDEMVTSMTKHVIEKHPDVAREMEKMHKDDPKKWGKEMKPKWDAAPEV